MSPEVREKMSENMKRINAERIEKARLRSEEGLKQKEAEIKRISDKKLESVSKKKQQIQQIKTEKGLPVEPVEPTPNPTPKPAKEKQTKKQVIVELSSDSDDSTDSDESGEEEIIYVAKKTAKNPRKQSTAKDYSIIKPKKHTKPKSIPDRQPDIPKTIIKFI
jgi:hypothetical protein